MRKARSVRRSARIRDVRPPMRGGVNAVPIVLPEGGWTTIADWCQFRFGDDGLAALVRGDFFADGGVPISFNAPYLVGRRIWVYRPVSDEPAEPIMLDVVAENERFLVVDKPHGMATIPRGSHVARTVTVAARRQFLNDDLVPAHRLDAETAGLVLLTKAVEFRGRYQKLFEQRRVGKAYRAVAPGVAGYEEWRRVELRMERIGKTFHSSVIEGQPNAITDLRIRRNVAEEGLALWELRPVTGKTHQLRVTLNHLGAPIVGDPLYPRLLTLEEIAARPLPLQLLAAELWFVDPIDGVEYRFESTRALESAAAAD